MPFDVPEGWVWTTLDSICILIEDCCHSTAKNEGSGYPLIRTSNVGIGYLILDNVHRVSETIYKKRNVRATPQANDIIYAREAPAGNAALVKENEYVCLGQRTVLIRPMFVNPKWLTYIINSPTIRRLLINQATGSTVLHVNMESIRSLRLPIPSLTEQNRIVDKIEEIITIIDTIELDTTNLKSAVEKIKLEVLSLAFHGKLVPQDPNDESASELLKRINQKAEITCDNGHYRNLPNSWCVLPMQMICSLSDGDKQTGIKRLNLDVKFLRGEREGKILNEGRFTPANSLLILVDGENSGEVFRTPIEGYKGTTFKQLVINNNMNIDYVLQVINCHRRELRENKVGSAIPHLNKKLFKAIEVPIPPYQEQQRIVDTLRITFKHLDTIMENL